MEDRQETIRERVIRLIGEMQKRTTDRGATPAEAAGREVTDMTPSDDRELKLPAWAREIIKDLRFRLSIQNESLIREVTKLRPLVEYQKRKNEAMTDLLECAARGGHKTAQEIMDIIGQYELTLTKRED